jgi:glutathione synthase/RimK-type ligase-like ATP-grasp enzyme
VKLVERNCLDGHSGYGIKLIRNDTEVTHSARLWTAYKKKKDEWRVHFFKKINGEIEFFFQKKLLVMNSESPVGQSESQFKVRNYANGWVYSPNRSDCPGSVMAAAVSFAYKTSLDFGAIDILYNERNRAAWVLEINSAPGAIESTARWYAKNFSQYFDAVRQGRNKVLTTRDSTVTMAHSETYRATIQTIVGVH